MTEFFGWPPMWGTQSPSPFVIKTMVHLDMLGIEYTTHIVDFEQAPYGKGPYVIDEGKVIGDSTLIRRYFEQKLSKDLDQDLSAEQRACAWAFDRMMELQLGPFLLHERWLVPHNFDKGPRQFFMGLPDKIREEVISQRLEVIRRRFNGMDISKFSDDEKWSYADNSIASIANYLAEKAYMMGDNPTGIDASVFGFMSALATDFFDTPLVALVAKHPNITDYLARMEARYFAEPKWQLD